MLDKQTYNVPQPIPKSLNANCYWMQHALLLLSAYSVLYYDKNVHVYPKESGKTVVYTVLYIRAHIVVCLCYIMYVLVDSTSIYDAF